jgi:hypothetical protein
MSMPVRMPVSVRIPMLIVMPMPIFMPMLMRTLRFMSMFMPVIVPTVIVSFHPRHLTLVVPATTYSSPAAGVVAPPHNTAKFE